MRQQLRLASGAALTGLLCCTLGLTAAPSAVASASVSVRAASVLRPDGTEDVFTRNGSDGHLIRSSLPAGGSWQVQDLTAAAGSPAPDANATGLIDRDGVEHVLTQSGGRLYDTSQAAGSGSWQVKDTGAVSIAGNVAAVLRNDGTVDVFGRGNAGDLIQASLAPGQAWQVYDLTEVVGSPRLLGSPAAVVRRDGTVDVYTHMASSDHLAETYLQNGSWQVYNLSNSYAYDHWCLDPSGNCGDLKTSGSPSVTLRKDGTVDVFTETYLGAFSVDEGLTETYLPPGGSWNLYFLDHAKDPSPDISGSPTATVRPDGTVDVFSHRASDNHPGVSTLPPGDRWHYYDFAHDYGTPATQNDAAVGFRKDGSEDVLLVDTSNGHLMEMVLPQGAGAYGWQKYDLTTQVGVPAL
ncbi:hypothetical protein [Kitasatospora sp. NPDC094011]|uniref:hypothetical protein n=1 Tax=Kitasatospora sp. NPDC094011 TaxID=3364090 RepID=UPI003818A7B7